jgi:hypothetical protein
MKLLKITDSTKPEKKMMAVFETEGGRTKTIHFGSRGMDDYTITKDKEQRERYLNRHRSAERWDKYDSAGALSRWILWGDSVSRQKNIASFKQRFNL